MGRRPVTWIVINQYGGRWFIRKQFNTDREALEFMNSQLNEEKNRKGPGARLTCHVYELFGSYAN